MTTGIYRFLDLEKNISSGEEMEEILQALSEDSGHTLVRLKLQEFWHSEDFAKRIYWRDQLQEKLLSGVGRYVVADGNY